MFPTTEVKTHAVTFKNSDDAIYVTQDVAVSLSKFRNHPSSVSFPLVNKASGRLIRDIGKYEIKSIHEIKKENLETDRSGAKWVCDYGVKHYMHNVTCKCYETYISRDMGVSIPVQFIEWCRRMFPKASPKYVADITDVMRNKFLEQKSLITKT